MTLRKLLQRTEYKVLQGGLDIEITDISYDSRTAAKDCIFVCLTGFAADGHAYIESAVKKGAAVVVVSRETDMLDGITYIITDDTRKALAHMSCVFFGDPSREIDVIGITGTKGKTTTAYMVKKILEASGGKTGLIGTIETIIDEKREKSKNTTPESYELQKLLHRMVEAGCKYAVSEVSSQGLKMHRVTGTEFKLGIYTNFSRDHIGPGEHESLEDYLHSKTLFFDMCQTALINADCPMYSEVTSGGKCAKLYYGAKTGDSCFISADNIITVRRNELLCVDFTLKEQNGKSHNVHLGIMGRHSVYNALSAFGTASFFGIDLSSVASALSDITVPGRANPAAAGLPFTVIIDYAHNELSMESLLRSLREYKPNRLLCLFGCGGNRDRARRFAMGEMAGRYADLSILTEDNPRNEEVSSITNDILTGLLPTNGYYEIVYDRRAAIEYMLSIAKPGDICAVIGKGHEDYQEINGIKHPFSEKEIIAQWAERQSSPSSN